MEPTRVDDLDELAHIDLIHIETIAPGMPLWQAIVCGPFLGLVAVYQGLRGCVRALVQR